MTGPAGSVAREGEALAAAGLLLLRPPDEAILDALGLGTCENLGEYRQHFYDRLCMPWSTRYLPGFEHVFRKATVDEGGVWHFPPAHFEGGKGVEMLYQQFGFEHHRLPVEPQFQGPHIPGDHLGFMLIFLGRAWELPHTDAIAGEKLSRFATRFLGEWVDNYLDLLPAGMHSPYLDAVAGAMDEAVEKVRETLFRDVADKPIGCG